MTANTNTTPIVGKLYCSSSQTVHVVRKRPHVVNGGGFVVMDSSGQRVLFRVDGCGVRGKKGDLILREGDGDALLLMLRKVYIYHRFCKSELNLKFTKITSKKLTLMKCAGRHS